MFAAYFLWCWLRGGQTLAMKAWHIRLVDVTPRKALLRFLLALPFLPISILWALFDRDRQFLHDRLAGTRPGERLAAFHPPHHHDRRHRGRRALGTMAAESGGQFCSRPMCEKRLFSMWKKMPSMMPRNTLTPTMPARACM